MKRSVLIVFLTCCILPTLLAQRIKEISLKFDEDDFYFEESKRGLGISSGKHAIQYGYDTSEPGLPYVIVHVLIGSNEQFEGVTFDSEKAPIRQQVSMRRNPDYLNGHKDSTRCHVNEAEYTKAIYPTQNVKYAGTHVVDGYKYISLLVCPFTYRSQEKQLEQFSSMHLNVRLVQNVSDNSQRGGRAMRNIVENLVVNGDDMNLLYGTQESHKRVRSDGGGISSSAPFDYLIITADSLRGTYQKLANWKTRKGVPTRIITVEEIDTTFSGTDSISLPYYNWNLYLAIKRAIKSYKENFDIKYVLLGGDSDMIPTPKCYYQYDTLYHQSLRHDSGRTPCDFYYACIAKGENESGFLWDKADDHEMGSYLDQIDYHPQVFLTRLSTNTIADAEIQVQRIIDYEKNPPADAWRKELLMAGCEFNHTENGVLRPISDVEEKGNLIWNHISPIWYDSNRFRFYDTWTDHPLEANYDVTATHFNEQLEKGFPFIHVDTHGGYDCFLLEKFGTNLHYFYNNSDAYNFQNPFYSIIVTSACYTNDFYQGVSLSESLMRNPNGGIIGYWGHAKSMVGLDDETMLSALDIFNLRFYRSIFQSNEPRFGEAATLTKLAFIAEYDNNHPDHNMPYSNPYRTYLFTLNPLGDPEMPIYIEQPKEFYYKDFYFENDSVLYLNFTDYPDECNLCIMSLDDNGASYYSNETVSFGTLAIDGITLNLPSTHNYSLCFTQAGYKPYVLNLYRNGYVQNDTIANDAIVLSNQVQIGSNVTTAQPIGPVSVEQGRLVIRAPQGTTIKNNFTLKKGASLTIDSTIEAITNVPEE